MEAANQVATYIIFEHSSQSDGSFYSGRPSLTCTICRFKDLEWDLFCFHGWLILTCVRFLFGRNFWKFKFLIWGYIDCFTHFICSPLSSYFIDHLFITISLITAELHLLMPQRFAENRTQIKNRALVRMGHKTNTAMNKRITCCYPWRSLWWCWEPEVRVCSRNGWLHSRTHAVPGSRNGPVENQAQQEYSRWWPQNFRKLIRSWYKQFTLKLSEY